MTVSLPQGFACHVTNVGVKDDTDDFVVVSARSPVAAAGMFTRSRFVGPSVTISREHLADGRAQAIVVVSKNANVANGPAGRADAEALVAAVASRLGCAPGDVLVASTGVIGRRYPIDRLLAGAAAMPCPLPGTDAVAVARGMMTTDTVPKVAEAFVGDGPARVVGVAKGVGMIEPDMATMLAFLFTDASVSPDGARRSLPARRRAHVQLRQHRHRHIDQRHGGRPRQWRRRRGRRRRAGGRRSAWSPSR